MSSLKTLLSEAEQIRKDYRAAITNDEKSGLRKRYEEIETAIQNLKPSAAATTEAKPKRQKRVTLSQKDSAEGAAADLLALCESLTSDGSISNSEIHQLRDWLASNASSDVPAIAFLRDVVEIVLQDNQVTIEERKQLYKAIEKVLPADIRKYVSEKRKIVEALDKENAKKARREEREQERARTYAERIATASVIDADFMVAGVSYEGRERIVRRHVSSGDSVTLVREPNNKFSKFATAIQIANGKQIGYVPEEWAEDIAPLLDSGHRYRASVKKILDRGRIPIPVVVAEIFAPDSKVDGLSQAKISSRSSSGSGCGCMTMFVLVLSAFVFRWMK